MEPTPTRAPGRLQHAHTHPVALDGYVALHHGQAGAVRAVRTLTLDRAYAAHPERFVRKHPEPPASPTAVWINRPEPQPDNSLILSAT